MTLDLRSQLYAAYLASGLTQGEIAHRAGVCEKTLWNILAGRDASIRSVCAVAMVLDVRALEIQH